MSALGERFVEITEKLDRASGLEATLVVERTIRPTTTGEAITAASIRKRSKVPF